MSMYWLGKRRPRKLFIEVYTDSDEDGRPRRYYGVINSRCVEVARFMYRAHAVEYVAAFERKAKP